MPVASPEEYLNWLQWWRDACRFMASAATLGAVLDVARGRSAVLDLIDFDGPQQVEAQAREAIRDGLSTVAPTITVDPDLATEARRITHQRLQWLAKMAGYGGPQMDPRTAALMAEARAANDRTFADADADVGVEVA